MPRTHIYLSDQSYRTLEDLSQQKGKSMSMVIGDALRTYRWLNEIRAQGGKVLAERDGVTRELVSL